MQTTRFYLKKEELDVPNLNKSAKYRDSEDLVALARELTKDEEQEVMLAFFLDAQNLLLGYIELARGGFDWVKWDKRMLFTAALLCGAKKVILSHNHPSGRAKPSRQDVANMKNLIPAADLLGIAIYDHIVVAKEQWVSMSDYGLLPSPLELIKDADRKREEGLDSEALSK